MPTTDENLQTAFAGESQANRKYLAWGKQAEKEGCDYLGVGPVYSTETKPQERPSGISYVREARNSTKLPWFAIGGINCSNLDEILSVGTKKIAVSGAIMNSNTPAVSSLELMRRMS